ncbi:MAG: hypothetical protein AAGE01_09615 [Pseudomonadota bacterium]
MALWLPEPASAEAFGWLVLAAIFGVVIYRSVSKAKRQIGAAKASPAAWDAAATANGWVVNEPGKPLIEGQGEGFTFTAGLRRAVKSRGDMADKILAYTWIVVKFTAPLPLIFDIRYPRRPVNYRPEVSEVKVNGFGDRRFTLQAADGAAQALEHWVSTTGLAGLMGPMVTKETSQLAVTFEEVIDEHSEWLAEPEAIAAFVNAACDLASEIRESLDGA